MAINSCHHRLQHGVGRQRKSGDSKDVGRTKGRTDNGESTSGAAFQLVRAKRQLFDKQCMTDRQYYKDRRLVSKPRLACASHAKELEP